MRPLISPPEGFLFSVDQFEAVRKESGSLSGSCKTGYMAEMRVALDALDGDFAVFFPIGHAHKADLIFWKPPHKALAIQVKKATHQPSGSFKFMVGSGKPSCAANPNEYGKRYTPYKKGDFDFLCAYIEERKSCVFYNLDEIAGASSMTWHPDKDRAENNWDLLTP